MDARWKSADDPELVRACRDRNERAWNVLVARYRNLVYSAALGVGLDADGAAEVHQRVWIELHRSLERLRDPQALPRWLVVTTRRLAYEHATREGRFVEQLREELLEMQEPADAELIALEERQRLEKGLMRLGRRCRNLLTWLFLAHPRPSYREIGRRLGVAVGSIGAMRSRCLARLERELEAP